MAYITFDFNFLKCYYNFRGDVMQKIISILKNLDKDTYKILKYGLLFSSFLCLSAIGILLGYIFLGINLFYHLGLVLMQSSFTFAVEFVICGIVVDSLKKYKI